MNNTYTFIYPRRRWIRTVVSRITRTIFNVISKFEVVGIENFPKKGPILVVANHFSFLDPVAMVSIAPCPIEFVGGFRTPNAPPAVSWLRKLWGYYPVYRGTGSQIAFRAAQAVLNQQGVMAIFPEGSSAYAMLREPRLGAAFMAARAKTQILPVGMDGLTEVFPSLRKGKRARVLIRVGKPFGPFSAPGRGRERRQRLEAIGDEIMRHIAELIPPERRGYYSKDPALRQAATGIEDYPWDETPEA
jgi:1-acyl-sn-glycerol-3-phosphate acyltransferase